MRPRALPWMLLLLGTATVVPAMAQRAGEAGAPYPAACDAAKVSKQESDRAHNVFLSGKQFLDESNYDKAIQYFRDAYTLDCSVHEILPIIATALERKGDRGEAIRALEEYLKRAPAATDREKIERRIKNLKDQQAATPPTVSAPTAAASAPPAGSGTANAAPTPSVPPASSSNSLAPWIVVGAGGAVFLGGGILFLVGNGKVSSAEASCDPNPPGSHQCRNAAAIDEGNSGRSLRTVGGVLAGVGLAAVGGGLVWHFMTAKKSESQAALRPRPQILATPQLEPGYAGVSVGGKF